MNKIIMLLVASTCLCAIAQNPVSVFNEKEKYGEISGRIQSLSMYRDFEGGGNGFNSTLGAVINYTSPELAGFDAGLGFNYVWEFYKNNNSGMLANDDINVLNEAWIRYSLSTNAAITVGRKINNGEVFRADDFRQKARSIEAVQLDVTAVKNLKLTLGHAFRMSNWIDAGDRWDFNDFGDVFGAADDTDGVTWGEAVYSGIDNLEVALFDAYAYDVANLIGTRAKYNVTDESALVGYYRHESDVGESTAGDSDAFGLSLQQKIGDVTLEPGYFGVHGSTLRFQETTTGINHPLGSSMIIYSSQFAGGSDTAYLKAVTKVGKTVLYGLYNYTWHDKLPYDGQELNIVVKQPICENLTVAFKGGVGYRDIDGSGDTTALDTRLFITYSF